MALWLCSLSFSLGGLGAVGLNSAAYAQTGLGEEAIDSLVTQRRIIPNDKLLINVRKISSLSGGFNVDDAGMVDLELIGKVKAAGLKPAEFETILMEMYERDYLQNPFIRVEITDSFKETDILGFTTQAKPQDVPDLDDGLTPLADIVDKLNDTAEFEPGKSPRVIPLATLNSELVKDIEPIPVIENTPNIVLEDHINELNIDNIQPLSEPELLPEILTEVKLAPVTSVNPESFDTLLGLENDNQGQGDEVFLDDEARLETTHIIDNSVIIEPLVEPQDAPQLYTALPRSPQPLEGEGLIFLPEPALEIDEATLKDNDLEGTEWTFKNDERAYIQFLSDQEIAGFTGCNNFYANYKTGENFLYIDIIAMTFNECADVKDGEFQEALESITNYQFNQPNDLMFLGEDNVVILSLKKGFKSQ